MLRVVFPLRNNIHINGVDVCGLFSHKFPVLGTITPFCPILRLYRAGLDEAFVSSKARRTFLETIMNVMKTTNCHSLFIGKRRVIYMIMICLKNERFLHALLHRRDTVVTIAYWRAPFIQCSGRLGVRSVACRHLPLARISRRRGPTFVCPSLINIHIFFVNRTVPLRRMHIIGAGA